MSEPLFLTEDEILFSHQQEIQISGSEPNVRNEDVVQACKEAPKASFEGKYLHHIFQMAASYIACLTTRHPLVESNKRTALASALTFLYLNGYIIEESHYENPHPTTSRHRMSWLRSESLRQASL